MCITISKKQKVTAAEKSDYTTKQNAYNTSLSALSKALEEAQNEIFINGIDGIEVGGRNLLLKSGIKVTNSTYGIKIYDLVQTHTYVDGDDYIVTIWGTLGAGKMQFGVYNSGGNVHLSNLIKVSNGVYRGYFKWKKTERSTTVANTTLNIYAAPNTVTASSTIDRIKLEKGTNPSDWTPASEDQQEEIDTAITNAAQAQNIANAANSKVNFLTATSDPKTGLISGGALLVGDSVGNNAGIVGTSEDGQSSVRLYAGAPYNQKKVAPFRVLNNGILYASNAFISGNVNATSGFFGGFKITVSSFESTNGVFHVDSLTGMQTLKDANGVVRNRKGLDSSGEPMDTWYDANGNERYSLTSRGIIYRNYVAESYGEERIGFIGTTLSVATATTALGWLYKRVIDYWGPAQQGPNQAAIWTVEGSWDPGGPSIYSYSAGVNENSENNTQYEGFYYTAKNKLGAKVANGWYISKANYGHWYGYTEQMDVHGNITLKEEPSYVIKTFSAFRISAGKKVESKTIRASTEWNMMGQTINGTPIKVPVSGVTII